MAVSLGHTVTDWFPNSLFIILPYLATDLGLSYSQVGVFATLATPQSWQQSWSQKNQLNRHDSH